MDSELEALVGSQYTAGRVAHTVGPLQDYEENILLVQATVNDRAQGDRTRGTAEGGSIRYFPSAGVLLIPKVDNSEAPTRD